MPGFDAVVELSSLDGTNGFQLSGEGATDFSGNSVASAGDVNGDGFDDLIVGAPGALKLQGQQNSAAGASYVVFGQAEGFAAEIELSELDGTNGFQISGESVGGFSGHTVASAGDVNGDGFDDLVISAPRASGNGSQSGATYVVFGQADGFAAEISLTDLDGTNGFQINGEAAGDSSGQSVASAGDLNGDGFDDVIVGARGASPNGEGSGASYVVFGQAEGFAAEIELSELDGANGFQISGEAASDYAGISVASAGDWNGDGLDDLIVGAPFAGGFSGSSYVVFGQTGGFAAEIELSALDGTNGFKIRGELAGDESGHSVAAAGDLNGDSYSDLIIAAPFADPAGDKSGACYVVFGHAGFAPETELSDLTGSNGFQISGEAMRDQLGLSTSTVASAGDVNGDGFDDVIIGACGADPNGAQSGASYVVFGKAEGFTAEIELSELDGTDGFQISGEAAGDCSGFFVASAGDMNGDGFDDLTVGTPYADPNGDKSGASYVIFGEATASVTRVGTGENDRLFGGDFADSLAGDDGGDLLDGRGGADSMTGGAGDDTYVVDNGDDTTVEAAGGGTDLVQSSAPTFTLASEVENLTLTGSAAINGTGNGLGNVITGNSAANTLAGGGGIDTASYAGAAAGVTVSLATTTAQNTVGAGTDTLSSIESLIGSSFIDTLSGTSGDNTVSGGGGADNVKGFAGNDILNGDAGDDTLNGGATNDTLNGGDNNDTLIGQDGNDTLAGGNGIDTASYVGAVAGVTVSLATTTAQNTVGDGTDTLSSIESLIGSSFIDTLSGTSGDNTVSGGGGADNVKGFAGNDILNGDAGDDTLNGGATNDTLNGGDNNDTLIGQDGNDTLAGGNGIDTASYVGAVAGVTVSLATTTAQNTVGDGTDTLSSMENLIGSGFADTLSGTSGDNTISGGGNNDNVKGFSGVDVLNGDNGNDTLNGGASNDTLNGGANDDDLIGQDGNDTLSGGTGADDFVFDDGHGADTVVDFQNGSDHFDLTAVAGIDDIGDLTIIDNGATVTVNYSSGSFTITNLADPTALDAGDFFF